MVRFRRRRKGVRAEIRPRAREKERTMQSGYHVYRVHERACAHTYVHARVSERDGVSGNGKGIARRTRRKKGKDPRIRMCARAGDIERNLKKKEKRDEQNRGRGGRERERERRGEIFVCGACVSYVRVYAKMKETGEERDETSSA